MLKFNRSLDIHLPIIMKIRQARRLEVNVIVVLFLQQNMGNKKTQQTLSVKKKKRSERRHDRRCCSGAHLLQTIGNK